MYHSITFIRKDVPNLSANTWDTWHMVSTSRPVISAPQPKINFVEIPGSSGSLDLSRALTPYPLYSNRSGNLEFAVVNDYEEWQVLHQKLLGFFQGYTMQMILEDDPDFYYEGVFAINEWKSNNDGTWSVVKIDYQCLPYKTYRRNAYKVHSSLNSIELTGRTIHVPIVHKFPNCKPVYPTFFVHGANNSQVFLRVVNQERRTDSGSDTTVGTNWYASTTPSLEYDESTDAIVESPETPCTVPNSLITNMSGNNTIDFYFLGANGGEVIVDFEIGVL